MVSNKKVSKTLMPLMTETLISSSLPLSKPLLKVSPNNMMLKLLSSDGFKDLFEFEQRNWDYFAQSVGARPDTYKEYESFCNVQNEIIQEQDDGDIAFYLIYQKDKTIGRVNLRNMKNDSISLGYRICESAIGQGVASFAVSQILRIAKQKGLVRLNAEVWDANIASEKVLQKNGFEYSHTEVGAVSLNDKMINLKHFYKMLT